jgi:outer membrane protein OmpA-like peptidoglycan-associated protein
MTRYLTVTLLPLAILVGCASTQKGQAAAQAQLEAALTALQQAEVDPNVRTYAPGRLAEAQRAVQAADRASDPDDVQQLAYVAERRAQIASLWGATGKAEQDGKQLNKETSDIVLQKRERELKAARADADQARTAAEARARDAEAKAREADAARAQAEAAVKAQQAEQTRTAMLTKELSELKAQQTDRGVVLTVGDVLFETGKADIALAGVRSVDKLADFLKKNPNRQLLIEGFTDNTGSEDFNMSLSQQRADAVRDLLVARGIDGERITTKGYGPQYPVASNDSAAGRQQNRRVEVVVLNEGVSPDSASR